MAVEWKQEKKEEEENKRACDPLNPVFGTHRQRSDAAYGTRWPAGGAARAKDTSQSRD